MQKKMKFFMSVLVFLAISQVNAAYAIDFEGKIVKVIDSSTVVVVDQLNEMFTTRIFGIKAPELGEIFESDAKQFLSDLALDRAVTGYFVYPDEVDRHTLNSADSLEYSEITLQEGPLALAEEMIISGMALWDSNIAHYRENLKLAQDIAKAERAGLWGKR